MKNSEFLQKVARCFASHPGTDKIFSTADGQLFLSGNITAAYNHAVSQENKTVKTWTAAQVTPELIAEAVAAEGGEQKPVVQDPAPAKHETHENSAFDEPEQEETITPTNYKKLKLADLQALCTERGISYETDANKAALTALLEAAEGNDAE